MKQTDTAPAAGSATVTVYGIPNCDTVKRARDWLTRHGIDYRFHDFKKAGVDAALVEGWLRHGPAAGLDLLINRKGTTWRGLDDARKAAAGERRSAIALMCAAPSVIKRPVLTVSTDAAGGGPAQKTVVGFSDDLYATLFEPESSGKHHE